MTMPKWDELDGYMSYNDMDPVYEDAVARALSDWPMSGETLIPVPVDVHEERDALIIRAEVPEREIDPEHIQVSFEAGVINVLVPKVV